MNIPIQDRARRRTLQRAAQPSHGKLLLCACVALALTLPSMGGADPEGIGDNDPEPDAGTLLRNVRAQFPREAFTITGQLRTYPNATRRASRRPVHIRFELGRQAAPRAVYTVQDAFGSTTARLTVERPASGKPSIRVERGTPLHAVAEPKLDATIGDTDLSWMDLSMSYLWWRDGEVVGRDTVKGQECFIVDMHRPENEPGPYATARLWIGASLPVLLRAEGFDANGVRLRRMSVRSFKKVNDQWMIKDLDIARTDGGGRTRLVIDDLQLESDTE